MQSNAGDTQLRIGVGYDVHQVKAGRKLVLGGIEIPSDFGCDAHSDGDVIAHALADAILGAVALPDIGHYFPPSDPACEGIDSMKILSKAVSEARSCGYKPSNVDIAVIAERPKIGPLISAMREKLSTILGIPADCIGIKATTNEGVGDIGKGLAIATHAVCLLAKI